MNALERSATSAESDRGRAPSTRSCASSSIGRRRPARPARQRRAARAHGASRSACRRNTSTTTAARELFEAICELPEYYLTRTEHALLRRDRRCGDRRGRSPRSSSSSAAAPRARRACCSTRSPRSQPRPAYVPIDVSESMLRQSAAALRAAYPRAARARASSPTTSAGCRASPVGRRRLVAFLGSTIGNFEPPDDVTLPARLASRLQRRRRTCCSASIWSSRSSDAARRVQRRGRRHGGVQSQRPARPQSRAAAPTSIPARFDHVAFYDRAAGADRDAPARPRRRTRCRSRRSIWRSSSPPARRSTPRAAASSRAPCVEAMLDSGGFRLERWYASRDDASPSRLRARGRVE